MGGFVTVPQDRDAYDTFYKYVLPRTQSVMATIAPAVQSIVNGNPVSFRFGGIVQARDWPMPKAALNTPYLLLLTDGAIPYGGAVSQYSPQLRGQVSWAWQVQGDNTPADAQQANRGDKYGINRAIIQALRAAHYPGFTQKLQWSIEDDGTGNPESVSIPYNPPDQVRWGMPKFTDKIDRTSGIIFGSAAVTIVSFASPITA